MSQLTLGAHGVTLVSEGAGYGLLVGLGAAFCGVILVAVQIQKRFLSEDSANSEMFMVANRSVGTGLTASAVFSSWMWINETVLATSMCYKYGLAVPFLWGGALSVQIVLMTVLGVLAKMRTPYAHTSLEIVRMRYGTAGHVVFIALNLVNNVLGCASMILTGSQILYGVSGVHFAAATVLIPLGVVLYTAVGGLKATFLTDFFHTAIALVLIIYFTLATLTHPTVGGLHGLYDQLIATAPQNLIAGNYQGSLLTIKSRDAIIWALILRASNTANVVMDTAYWQKSFATEVRATVPGYNLAALAIHGVPWGLGTVMGLAARALHHTPAWPTYPDDMTAAEVSAGFVMPYVIKAVIGDRGVLAFFVLVFMALTSTISSSLIAVSSILSFDVYKTYFRPRATDRQLVRASHVTVLLHAAFMTGIALALNYGGADMTWISYFRPVVCCPGVAPLALTLVWRRQTRAAAILAPLLGMVTGVGVWLGVARHKYGHLSLATTEASIPALAGAIASILSPLVYSVVISQIRPTVFDWREFLRIELVDQQQQQQQLSGEEEESASSSHSDGDKEKTMSTATATATATTTTTLPPTIALDNIVHPLSDDTLRDLRRWYHLSWATLAVVTLVLWVLWPMPLYRDYIFTRSFFSGWTTVAIFWQFLAFFVVVVYPLYDGRHAIAKGARGVWGMVRGRTRSK